jgi:hypothetical protein
VSDHAALALAFHKHYVLGEGSRSERLAAADLDWAWEEVEAAVREREDRLLPLLDAVLDVPGADRAYRAYVGAGAIEDLLNRGEEAWGQAVADRCRRSSAWREAVAAVNLDDRQRTAMPMLDPYLPNAG